MNKTQYMRKFYLSAFCCLRQQRNQWENIVIVETEHFHIEDY